MPAQWDGTVTCLGEFGTVVAVRDDVATVEFGDGSVRDASVAGLLADGVSLCPGDPVMVSMGLALLVPEHRERSRRLPLV